MNAADGTDGPRDRDDSDTADVGHTDDSDDPGDPGDSDADENPDRAEEEFAPEGFERWRRESALGSVGTGVALGLQYVFAPPADEPAMVAEAPGEPPDPDRLQVILDPDDPTKSVALLPPHTGADQDKHHPDGD